MSDTAPETVDGKNIVPLHQFVQDGPKKLKVVSVRDLGNDQPGADLEAVLARHVDTKTYVAGTVRIDPKTPNKMVAGEVWEVSVGADSLSFPVALKVGG